MTFPPPGVSIPTSTEHDREHTNDGINPNAGDADHVAFPRVSFRRTIDLEPAQLIEAARAFRETYATEVRELTTEAVAAELRREVEIDEDDVAVAHARLTAHGLPGAGMLRAALEQMKSILTGSAVNAVLTFSASHAVIKAAVKRATELDLALSKPRLAELERAREALSIAWRFLKTESDLDEAIRARAATLEDALARETFFLELPAIDQHARAIADEYSRRLVSVSLRRYFADRLDTEEQLDAAIRGLREECAKRIRAGTKVIFSLD